MGIPPVRYTGRWGYHDWHEEHCDGQWIGCEKNFCRKHRRVFNICQDFESDRSVGYWGGDGECVSCKREAETERYIRGRLNDLHQKLGLPKSA